MPIETISHPLFLSEHLSVSQNISLMGYSCFDWQYYNDFTWRKVNKIILFLNVFELSCLLHIPYLIVPRNLNRVSFLHVRAGKYAVKVSIIKIICQKNFNNLIIYVGNNLGSRYTWILRMLDQVERNIISDQVEFLNMDNFMQDSQFPIKLSSWKWF